MKSAIQAVQDELYKIQNEMQDCCTEEGIVKIWLRERYLTLMKEEIALRENLDWLRKTVRELKKS